MTTRPRIRFTPYAWAKLLYLRDAGPTEIGGFGLTSIEDPLLVTDILMVKQTCTTVTVDFDDDSIAELFDEMVDLGYQPCEFGRVWIHTHPGDSPYPSATDETTFSKAFGKTDWAVMFIIAEGGATYARLKFNVGPGSSLLIRPKVDFTEGFAASAFKEWKKEYDENVFRYVPPAPKAKMVLVPAKPAAGKGIDVREFYPALKPASPPSPTMRSYGRSATGITYDDEDFPISGSFTDEEIMRGLAEADALEEAYGAQAFEPSAADIADEALYGEPIPSHLMEGDVPVDMTDPMYAADFYSTEFDPRFQK